jgi:hypothetical protein
MLPPDGRKMIAQIMVMYHITALNAYLIAYAYPIYMNVASIIITLSAFFNIAALAMLPLEIRSIGASIADIIALTVFLLILPISLSLLINAVIFITQHPLMAITYLGLAAVAWFAYERRAPSHHRK